MRGSSIALELAAALERRIELPTTPWRWRFVAGKLPERATPEVGTAGVRHG
jgi:hypothetical protein